jgi:hypothetical protein
MASDKPITAIDPCCLNLKDFKIRCFLVSAHTNRQGHFRELDNYDNSINNISLIQEVITYRMGVIKSSMRVTDCHEVCRLLISRRVIVTSKPEVFSMAILTEIPQILFTQAKDKV